MNGKQCKAIRRLTSSKRDQRHLKRDRIRDRVALAQNPKLPTVRARKTKDPIAPTWPKTEDQRAQSRPLIVVGPRRVTQRDQRDKLGSSMSGKKPNRVSNTMARAIFGMLPKHLLDWQALRYPQEYVRGDV